MRGRLGTGLLILATAVALAGAGPAAARSRKPKLEPAVTVVLACPGGDLSAHVEWSDGAGGKGRVELHVYEIGIEHEHDYTRDLFKSSTGTWDVDVRDHTGVYGAQAELYFGRNWDWVAFGQGEVICPDRS